MWQKYGLTPDGSHGVVYLGWRWKLSVAAGLGSASELVESSPMYPATYNQLPAAPCVWYCLGPDGRYPRNRTWRGLMSNTQIMAELRRARYT